MDDPRKPLLMTFRLAHRDDCREPLDFPEGSDPGEWGAVWEEEREERFLLSGHAFVGVSRGVEARARRAPTAVHVGVVPDPVLERELTHIRKRVRVLETEVEGFRQLLGLRDAVPAGPSAEEVWLARNPDVGQRYPHAFVAFDMDSGDVIASSPDELAFSSQLHDYLAVHTGAEVHTLHTSRLG